MVWDGQERRLKSEDHDTLITVVQILKNHVENFDKHTATDESNFKILNRNMYIAIGVAVAFNTLPTVAAITRIINGGH